MSFFENSPRDHAKVPTPWGDIESETDSGMIGILLAASLAIGSYFLYKKYSKSEKESSKREDN